MYVNNVVVILSDYKFEQFLNVLWGEKCGKIEEGIIAFRPLTNSILVFGPQTTLQIFIKIERERRSDHRQALVILQFVHAIEPI